MRVTVDGRLVEVKEGSTIADLLRQLGLPRLDSLVEVSGSRAKTLSGKALVKPSTKFRSVPPIQQG